MRALQRWVDRITTISAGFLMALFMIIMIYNVFSRYLVGGGISWYMETSQFLNVWAMFIGGIGLCASNEHLRVSLLEESLKGKVKFFARVLVSLCSIAFYCFICYATYLLAMRTRQTVSTMPSVKMAWVYWPLPFTAALSALAVVVEFINYLLGNRKTEEKRDDRVLVD